MAFRGFQRSVGTQFGAAFPVAGDYIILRGLPCNSYGRHVPHQHHHYVYQQRLWAVGTHPPPPPPPPQWSGGGGGPALPVAGVDSRTQQLLPYYNYNITPRQNYYYVYQDFSNHTPQQFDSVREDETLILNGSTVHPRQQQQQHARRNNNAGGGAAGLSESQIKKCLKIKIIINSCPNYIDNRAATAGEDEESQVCAICLDDLYCPDQSNNNHHPNNINFSVGILVCKHLYHSDCIRRWLRVKNFRPMCKAVAYSS